MKVYYKNPVNNKVCFGSYDKLKNNDNLHYFNVNFYKTYKQAKNEKNYK